MTDDIRTAHDDGIGWIVFNRPAAGNAVTPALMKQLCETLDRQIADPDVRAIVLAGEGRHFCAGADFGFLRDLLHRETTLVHEELYHYFRGAAQRLFECPKPTIAAVNGSAITVGCELAIACDGRIATASARFEESWLRLGLIPPLGGAMLLPRLVGTAMAKQMILEARKVAAQEALAIGLVDAIVPDADLWPAAQTRAKRMASLSPTAYAAAKAALNRGMESAMHDEWAANIETQARLLGGEEFRNHFIRVDQARPRG